MLSRRGILAFAAFLLGFALTLAGVSAQDQKPQNTTVDDQGTFLIARRSLSDAFFAKSAVLMVTVLPLKPEPLVVGLIINKPTKVKLAELFPRAKELKKQDTTAYFGGPVDTQDRSAIFRSPTAPAHAVHILGDVYVTFDPGLVEDLVNKSKQPSELRIFLGRSQWSQAQLEHEILIGAWYKHTGNADPIFTADPGRVWQELLEGAAPSPYAEFLPPSPRTDSTRSISCYVRCIFGSDGKPKWHSPTKNDLASRLKTRLHFILPARPAPQERPAFVPRAEGTAS